MRIRAEGNAASETDTIKALERALILMDALKQAKQPQGVNELAKLCSINLSTTFRILKTLETHGWVFQLENTKYIPGEKISFVTERENFYLALKEVAFPVMNTYTAREGQAMNLLVRENLSCVILQQSRTDRILDYVPPIGTRLPLHASAGGKILLSELPPDHVEDLLSAIEFRRLTKHTITYKIDYINALDAVRKNGYALDLCESSEVASCVSVPIRNRKGEIIAALSFSGIIGVGTEQELTYYLPMLRDAASAITARLYRRFETDSNDLTDAKRA